MVVATIVCLLTGVTMPVLGTVKQKASQTTCLSNLKQIGSAYALYASDNSDYVPPYTNWELYLESYEPGTTSAPTDSAQPELLFNALSAYGVKQVGFCPMDEDRGRDVYRHGIRHRFWSYWFRPYRVDQDPSDAWPIRFNLSSDVAAANRIVQDAVGLDRSPLHGGETAVVSSHRDLSVNVLAPDLSVRNVRPN